MLGRHVFDRRASGRNAGVGRVGDVAQRIPDDAAVEVVRTLGKAQSVGGRFAGLVEHLTIPTGEAKFGQHIVLLRQGQCVPSGSRCRGCHRAPPVFAGSAVVVFARAVDETVLDISAFKVDLTINGFKALELEHNLSLRQRELLKRRCGQRRKHATPVRGTEVKRTATFGKATHPDFGQRRICLEEMQTVITLVTQGMGHDVFLCLTQAGKGAG